MIEDFTIYVDRENQDLMVDVEETQIIADGSLNTIRINPDTQDLAFANGKPDMEVQVTEQVLVFRGGDAPPGARGQDGVSLMQEFDFNTPTASWVLNYQGGVTGYPDALVIDTSGRTVYGMVTYNSNAQLQIDFSAPVSGRAFLKF